MSGGQGLNRLRKTTLSRDSTRVQSCLALMVGLDLKQKVRLTTKSEVGCGRELEDLVYCGMKSIHFFDGFEQFFLCEWCHQKLENSQKVATK